MDALEECVKARKAGRPAEEAAAFLFDRGLTIVEAIKIIMNAYDLPLGAAKCVVTSAPSWRAVVEASKPLHDEGEQTFGQKGDE